MSNSLLHISNPYEGTQSANITCCAHITTRYRCYAKEKRALCLEFVLLLKCAFVGGEDVLHFIIMLKRGMRKLISMYYFGAANSTNLVNLNVHNKYVIYCNLYANVIYTLFFHVVKSTMI